MKTSQRDQAAVAILQYLQENTTSDQGVSAASILADLSEKGIETDRRTVYNEIHVLQKAGYPIRLIHQGHSYTYAIDHAFTLGETFLLNDAIFHSAILSETEKQHLSDKLNTLLPSSQRLRLPQPVSSPLLSGNEAVPETIDLLLHAIHENRMVSFTYFDLNPKKQKVYRRQGNPYLLQPVSIISSQNRYYCIFYSAKHEHFANYRIDKIDGIRMEGEGQETPRFDPDAYMKQNFNMYSGDARAITMEVDNSLASVFFDTFGMDVLIEQISQNSFTALIRKPVVPTIEAWFFQFCDKVTVTGPEELKEDLRSKAEIILHKLDRPKEK
jgi:predicted DNA-binding transcriptional regulator YafY